MSMAIAVGMPICILPLGVRCRVCVDAHSSRVIACSRAKRQRLSRRCSAASTQDVPLYSKRLRPVNSASSISPAHVQCLKRRACTVVQLVCSAAHLVCG